MILDDLFEQRPLPAHIKPSDLPPAMRQRLTMRDVERERPRGAYRYRVIPGMPGESPKDFLDLSGAEQYAQAVRGRVQPLEEQVNDPDVRRGMENVVSIERARKSTAPAIINVGAERFSITEPADKEWFLKYIMGYINTGQADRIYKLMGNPQGFESILDKFAEAFRDLPPEENGDPDLFGANQAGGPKAPRMQRESASQKKSRDLEEAPAGASARTGRMMAQMRARQPQATSDLEAMAYELQDAERRDAEEINKLEKEVDSLETDIKQDLQKRISTLTRRRGGIRQAAAQDTKIDTVLDQLTKSNDEQQREINNLERAVASLGQRPATATISPPAAKTEPPTQSPVLARAVSDLTRPRVPTPSSTGGTIEPTPTGMIHRAAQTTIDQPSTEEPKPIRSLRSVSKITEPTADTGTDQSNIFKASDEPVKKTGTDNLEEKKRDRSPGKITKSEDPCWSGYHMVGTKTKGGRTVPNCVPGAKGAANEGLRDIAEQAALAKLRTRDHPAFQMFAESWYRAYGGT